MLDSLGIDRSSERLYVALLESVSRDPAELAVLSGVPQRELGQRLAELRAVGLVHDDDGEVRPVPPGDGLVTLLARMRLEASARLHELDRSQEIVDSWLEQHHHLVGSRVREIELLPGVDGVRHKLAELARGCESEICSLNPGGPQSAANLASSRPLNEATLARGVSMRAVYLDSLRNDEATLEHARWLSSVGAQVRSATVLPVRLVIVDRTQAVVPVNAADSSQGGLLVTGQGLVASLLALFDMTWRAARPLGPRQPRSPDGLSQQEQEALRLWSQGATDESVARSLGVSVRTIRRMSESIAQRAGARSRFELGAKAVALGWIPSNIDSWS